MAIHKCKTKSWKKPSRHKKRRRSISNQARITRRKGDKELRKSQATIKQEFKEDVRQGNYSPFKALISWILPKKKQKDDKEKPEKNILKHPLAPEEETKSKPINKSNTTELIQFKNK